ncbi:MAG: GNAT family N-acetyltransferase [Thaumarchaeota archaeon]|nr:GNAT family N-acetyltransferase [Nitrososphaerota archaeon]
MIIERATASDADKIILLQRLAYKSEAELYDNFGIPPMMQTLKEMEDEFRYKTFLKAIVDDNIVGSVRAHRHENTCHIGRLMVHPDHQNKGIGTRLMNEIENLFDSCTRFELFTGNKSEKNISLYKSLGYKIFKTEKIDDRIRLVYMEKQCKV